MRPVDADALSKSINDGPGTPIQKFFADACVAAAPTLQNFMPNDLIEIINSGYDLNRLRKLIEIDRMIGKEFRLEIDRVYGTVDAVLIEKDGLHFRIEDKGGGTYYVNEAIVKIGTSTIKE